MASSQKMRGEGDLRNESLKRGFTNIIRANTDEELKKAEREFQKFLESQSRDLSSETLQKLFSDINHSIIQNTKGNNSEKIAALVATRALLKSELEGSGNKIPQLGVHVRDCSVNPDLRVMKMAVRCLKTLASIEGTLAAEFVQAEIKRAFDSLESSQFDISSARSSQVDPVSVKRHSAVLCLGALAKKAPTLFFVHVDPFFSLIWTALTDKQQVVRESSAKALQNVLFMIGLRRTSYIKEWYKVLYHKAKNGLEASHMAPLEVLHGSFLAITELLRKPGDFMRNNFSEISGFTLKFANAKIKDDKTGLIQIAILHMVPLLGSLSPEEFVDGPQDEFLRHLLDATLDDNYRRVAFRSLGELAKATASGNKLTTTFLERTLKAIKTSFSKKTKATDLDDMMMCLQLLSEAAGSSLSRLNTINDILPLIFSYGLRESMTRAVTALATHVPSMLPEIQERLLDLVSTILFKKTYADIQSHKYSMLSKVNPNESTALALRVLGTFDFEAHQLGNFVRDFLLSFLDQEIFEIRKETAITCAKIAVHPGERQISPHDKKGIIVGDIISRLLVVGISDKDPEIRRIILSSLEPRYDMFLGSSENLKYLFMGLNDEGFEIRSLSIKIIGRLAIQNPAYVMPSLRRTLVQSLTELEFSGNTRNKEESTKLLTCLIQSAGPVIKPYSKTILAALLPKIHDESPRVASAVLAALGELSKVAHVEMKGCVEELFPLILQTLKDQSSVFTRETSLRALGQLVSNLGYVITPYERYPNLLPILLNEMKTEQNPVNRMEVLRVFGLLGALDPYRHKLSQLEEAESRAQKMTKQSTLDPADFLKKESSEGEEEYYSAAAIVSLTKILADPTLNKHHLSVITVLMCICRTLKSRCAIFLPSIMPLFVKILKSGDLGIHDMLFQQISVLVELAKDDVRDYLDDIFELIHAFWDTNMLVQILGLVEKLIKILDVEIKVYLPGLVPLLLSMLHSDQPDRRLKVLSTLDIIGVHLADYLHLVIPAIVKMVELTDFSVVTQTEKSFTMIYLQTLGRLCGKLDISDYASRITHPLLRVLDYGDAEIRQSVVDVICVLLYSLGSIYAVFVPVINLALAKYKIRHNVYESYVSALLKGGEMDPRSSPLIKLGGSGSRCARADSDKNVAQLASKSKLLINIPKLKEAWEANHVLTKDDWHEWMRRFSVALLKESPNYALHQCLSLAQVYHPLARALFNYAFFSCWQEIDEEAKMDCVVNIKKALEASEIPPEILHALLNLAEFMEHNFHPLPYPITHKILGDLAEKNHAYAKALHCKEIEFQHDPTRCIEALISINNQLGLPEAAGGILTYAQQQQGMELKESWYEKLHQWEEALAAYEQKQEEDPDNFELMMGRLRCYNALGEWENVTQLARSIWGQAPTKIKIKAGSLAAGGYLNLRKFDSMERYVDRMDPDSVKGTFYRAIVACHQERFSEARKFISKAREFLDTELAALVSESYKRAYPMLCIVQQLSELEEVIEYKKCPERREMIRKMWKNRIWGCQRSIEVWRGILAVRSLCLSRMEDVDVYLKYSSLLRAQGRHKSSHQILVSMMDQRSKGPGLQFKVNRVDPRVAYHYIKDLWAAGSKGPALQSARSFVKANEGSFLQAKMFHKISEWKMQLEKTTHSEASLVEILAACKACTENGPNWYKAWHSWGLTNFEAVSFYEKQETKKARKKIVKHLVAAVYGFFRSIALSPGKSLQDTLRLLTLMFKHGGGKEAEAALMRGFATVSVDTWLQVIPQIIARIHSPNKSVRNLVKELLQNVGTHHPQALVYPLTVASTSGSESNSTANMILQQMRGHSELLVDQARLVSSELIRVSINWFESWNVGLESASRQFFKENDPEGMIQTLTPLHAQLDEGPSTQNEVSFANLFGRQLSEAQILCGRYIMTSSISYLHLAWQYYVSVFRSITTLLPFLTKLDLQFVSPHLLEADNLELAVPGTYHANQQVVRIRKFAPVLTVITSKQRPRRMTIVGDNGKDYTFLLKGHEDLRQDERVMQLFGLVNTLLAQGDFTGKLHLRITRYGAIPLSPNSGLIGWVPGCNTLHELIKQQREDRKMELKIEHKRQAEFAPKGQYDGLTLIQKVEVYQYAIASTPGDEFATILWTRSPNSEIWLDRRTQFTRSLAVMSMVGYILGLGDRHPSNLMLEKSTGKVLHIDFGDCFEVATHRDNYPEKIPFRLTRMLIGAMEVSGIEGNFRSTCEWVMRVLREHRDSLMAVLEAFVYDPLVNWRLAETANETEKKIEEDTSIEEIRRPDEPAEGTGSIPQSVSTRRLQKTRVQSERESEIIRDMSEIENQQAEVLNERAVEVISRVHKKLTGQDFSDEVLDVEAQVHKLVAEATSHENLSQLYVGWGPFW